jgi:sugar lactone lactonase YvrE
MWVDLAREPAPQLSFCAHNKYQFKPRRQCMRSNSLFDPTVFSLFWPRSAMLLGLLTGGGVYAAPATIELPGTRVFPESVTSTKDGTVFIGSLGSGGVQRIKADSTQVESWIKPGAYGSRSIFGVLADERSNTLWVCSNDMSGVGIVIQSAESGSALKGFDLKTGAGEVSVKLPGDKTTCNDIAIGPDGAAYVTNSAAAQILRLPPKGDALEVWSSDAMLAPPSGGVGLDGIAFGADGNVYVDTYTPAEMFRVAVKDGKAGKVTRLSPSRPLVLADAIRPLGGNAFLLIEGGGRLDRIVIKGDSVAIETLKDGFAVPTGVAIVGKTAWVSEGQLGYIFDPSKKGQTPSLPFHVYSVPLPVH